VDPSTADPDVPDADYPTGADNPTDVD
jgi:hypothetical protein